MKLKQNHFPVVIEQDEDGVFILSCPLFAGCHSYGSTIEEGLANITEAIEVCIEDVPKGLFNKIVRHDLGIDMSDFWHDDG